MQVVVIDYGMSNLGSITRALEECRTSPIVSSKPADLQQASHVILPGVGSFYEGMKHLRSLDFDKALNKIVYEDKVPLLGVCLGMQLLADDGIEGGKIKGLGLIEGTTIKLIPKPHEKIPHIGWNEVHIQQKNTLFKKIPEKTDYYFVHSYHFVPKDKSVITTTTPYCGKFVSSIQKDNIFGVQFHPEKSQFWGFQLLKNFLQFSTYFNA